MCRGDNFAALGAESDLAWYHGILAQAFEISSCTIPSTEGTDWSIVKMLNTVLRLDGKGLAVEAEARHVELRNRSLNLDACRET